MKEFQAAFLKSFLNSLRPEFMDSDKFDDSTMSPETKRTIGRIADYFYASDDLTKKRMSQYSNDPYIMQGLRHGMLNYRMVNEVLKLDDSNKSLEEVSQSEGNVGRDIKMILGSFKVNRLEDGGYRVTDIYDFENNNDYFRENFPAVTEFLDDLGVEVDNNAFEVMAGAYQSATDGSFYPIARALGETFISDENRPEEGSSTFVDFTIPKEDTVSSVPMPISRPEEVMLQVENYKFPTDPMDADRKNFLDKMLDFLIPSAQAGTINDNVKPLNDLQLFNKLKKGGYEPFPMDGNDEYGRMNDAQRAIVDMGESILESDMDD